MHKEPSWRAKAMYIVFACALVFGLAGVVAMPAQPAASANGVTISNFTASPDKGFSSLNVTFDATVGFTGNTSYNWNWGDGETHGTGAPPVSHIYDSGGVFTCNLTVHDDAGPNSATINIGVDPKLIPEGVVYDVKGHTQKFVIVNLPWTQSETEFTANVTQYGMDGALGMAQVNIACDDAVTGCACPNCQIVEWDLTLVNILGDAFDVIDGGGPEYAIGETNVSSRWCQNWIEVRALEPGDAHIDVYLDEDLDNDTSVANGGDPDDYVCNDKDLQLHVEKKWGEIVRTELDMDPETVGIQTDIYESAGSGEHGSGTAVQNTINETVYARFLLPDESWSDPLPAAHAEVHWWLFDPDDLVTIGGVTKTVAEWIQDEMAKLGPDGCGYWVGMPYPGIAIDNLLSLATPPTYTVFKDPADDSTDGLLKKVETMSDYSGQTEVKLDNIGGPETVLVVLLVDYPYLGDFAGEQPVCIEIGRKHYEEVPEIPLAEVKTPQLRWAGEKIILEKDWTEVLDAIGCRGRDLIAVYTMDQASIGVLYEAGDNPSQKKGAHEVWVLVDGNVTTEVILESEFQGKADVEVALYEGDWSAEAVSDQELYDSSLLNTGFLVYFLAFEEITWDTDISSTLTKLTPQNDKDGDPAHVAFEVKGYFTNELLGPAPDPDLGMGDDPAPRPMKWLDCDNDGTPDRLLPEGRWVLPDDWVRLAGGPGAYYERPNWDLMDKAHLDQVEAEIESSDPLGPFNNDVVTVLPATAAAKPSIGPFNTIQPWSVVDRWVTTASVQADMTVAAVTTVQDSADMRNTVVPDGEITIWDAPMPQALVVFDIVDALSAAGASLSGLLKSDLEGYGYQGDPKVYPSPFYAVEIPSSEFITNFGYNHNSWGFLGTTAMGPYNYWGDLMVDSIIANTTEAPEDTTDVEAYTDNHGIAAVQVDPLTRDGDVVITATARFPNSLKTAQYCAVTSDKITATWGAVDLNPHFTVDKMAADVGDTIIFTNDTTGGVKDYKLAEWDFDADGTVDVWCELGADVLYTGPDDVDCEPTQGSPVPWIYTEDGEYLPILCMTDGADTLWCEQMNVPPIVIGTPGVATMTIDASPFLFSYDGDTCDLPDALTNIGPPSDEYPGALDIAVTIFATEGGAWVSYNAAMGIGDFGQLEKGRSYVMTLTDGVGTLWNMCE